MSDRYRVAIQGDFMRMRLAVRIGQEQGHEFAVRDFGESVIHMVDRETVPDPELQPLWLAEDEARALYEALADYFGHTGNDGRALRRDYEDERKRVDRLIGAVIGADR